MRNKLSGGNIFKDLGFDSEESENLRIRALLMVEIEKAIRRIGLSQTEAARRMGVAQPRVSDLMRGKIGVFSVDGLIAMLSCLGLKVRVHVSRARAA